MVCARYPENGLDVEEAPRHLHGLLWLDAVCVTEIAGDFLALGGVATLNNLNHALSVWVGAELWRAPDDSESDVTKASLHHRSPQQCH